MDIDMTDFLILKQVQDADRPLWKNRIHDRQSERFTDPVSVQTIGRRVDRLQEHGYLDSCITSPEEIKRDLIIAFKLSEDGKDALRQKRRELLLHEIQQELFQHTAEERRLSKEEIIELICDEFTIGDDMRTPLDTYGREELLTFLLLYFVRDDTFDLLSDNALDTVSQLAEDCPQIAQALDANVQDIISQ